MVELSSWLSATPAAIRGSRATLRAVLAWRRIQDKPSEVSFTNADGDDLDAQTVRLEYDGTATTVQSIAGLAPVRRLIVFGIQGHPTQPDTDMAEGYTFFRDGDEYRIVDVIDTLGERQGVAEATG